MALSAHLPTSATTSSRVRRRPDRNDCCPCGSGRKYKRCCLERDEVVARRSRRDLLPDWVLDSRGKLNQFEKYAINVFDLPGLLGRMTDARRDPTYKTFDVVNSLMHAALLRLPSINALEGDLEEPDFQMLIGHKPSEGEKVFSAEVISNVLDKLDLDGPRDAIVDVFMRAERNKAFREGSYAAMRIVAVDGWEPFCSYDRHCPRCLSRTVKVKRADGEIEQRVQYYHRYVVAMLIGPVLDVVLAIESVRNDEAQRDAGEDARHEGELSAAQRLIDKLHQTYGTFIDAFVFDALYANGPVMTKLDGYGYGGFIVLKKEDNEPLKEALDLWRDQPPCRSIEDSENRERIDFWDADDIETLETYKGKVRVVRALVTRDAGDRPPTTWCLAIVGERARRVSLPTALKIIRARWHIENTAFNQWVQHWNLAHVYRHTANALLAILLLWSLVFNLLQLFIYRRLKRPRRPNDPTDTIRHIVEVMLRNLGAIPEPFPWRHLLDTS